MDKKSLEFTDKFLLTKDEDIKKFLGQLYEEFPKTRKIKTSILEAYQKVFYQKILASSLANFSQIVISGQIPSSACAPFPNERYLGSCLLLQPKLLIFFPAPPLLHEFEENGFELCGQIIITNNPENLKNNFSICCEINSEEMYDPHYCSTYKEDGIIILERNFGRVKYFISEETLIKVNRLYFYQP